MLNRILALTAGALAALPAFAAPPPAATGVTLEQIMAARDWIGNMPESGYWSDDSKTVLYRRKRDDSALYDLYQVDVTGSLTRKVGDAELGNAPAPGGDWNHDHSQHLFVRDDNVFVRSVLTGRLRQLTRDNVHKDTPSFMADGNHVQWHQGNDVYVYDLDSGMSMLAADVRMGEDANKPATPQNYLQAEQPRLFDFLSTRAANKQARNDQQTAQRAADATRLAAPFYLGKGVSIAATALSPNGRWLAVVTQPKSYEEGEPGIMPNYITDSGYVETSKEHTYVSLNPPPAQQVKLLDLMNHQSFDLDLTQLPGIKDDPLAALRKGAVDWDVQHGIAKSTAEDATKAPAVREVSVNNLAFSDDGNGLAVQFIANDFKDRWLATVDFSKKSLVTQERLSNKAWVNWTFNDMGWMHDGHELWYLSEADGWSHLYIKDLNAKAPRLISKGDFEINPNLFLSRDDKYFFVSANRNSPDNWEIYRIDAGSGDMQAITNLGGVNGVQPAMHDGESFQLAPDESKLMVYHSMTNLPPEIYVVDAMPNPRAAVRVTNTVSGAFTSIDWVQPKIVQVPSSHGAAHGIYARLYLPKDYSPAKSYPAIFFIHGAGYLQDAHSGWSYYYHEFMFETLLAQHGYIVMDMDYRGSAGYGRDWRTAIYRQMGHPEVEDITDGVHWLEQNYHVDPKRLGEWGGSYGGFMTYMMMFRAPDLFQAGAALRPVGDWADYNDGYTAAILNRPDVDPQAYFDSSPINYAGQLKGHLLILHGMEDDNVFFIDTVHMVQKLQELHNPNFDLMVYPVEHHDFHDAASWLDEYRRIYREFDTYVNPQ